MSGPGTASSRVGNVVESVYRAMEGGEVDVLGQLLSDDFRFTSNDPGFMAAFPEGFSREDELSFLEHLEESGHRATISCEAVLAEPSSAPFANPVGTFLVRVKGAEMRIHQGDAILMTAGPSEHVFEVECGPMPETNGHGSRCQVRRWHEDASGILAAIADSADISAAVAGPIETSERPDALSLRVLSNGKHGDLALSIALPAVATASLEMFDITGRRVESRELTGLGRGMHRVGIPAQLASGVYWARVRQGSETRTARVILVR